MDRLGSYADGSGEADLYLASVSSLGEWPVLFTEPMWRSVVEDSPAGFALFLACDGRGLSAELIHGLASYCIHHGVFWVSVWGHDRERLRDIFDEVDVALGLQPGPAMTTWHEDESLDEALLLFWDAFPADGRRGGAARVAVSVGSEAWLGE